MKYLLDTDICIYIIKKRPSNVYARLKKMSIEDVGVSSLTVAELAYGVAKSQRSEENRMKLTQFLAPFKILSFDGSAALAYGAIRAELEAKGQTIGGIDMLIAAQAVAEEVTLVSNNAREFSRISKLKLENWVGSRR